MLTKRRLFLLSGTFFLPDIIFGEQVRTPWQGAGPFYPEIIPEDSDYNLLKNGESSVEADGKILNLSLLQNAIISKRSWFALCL